MAGMGRSQSQQDFLTPMQDLARDAGALLMSFFGKVSIEYKGDVDLVTKADRASETDDRGAYPQAVA